MKKIALLAFVAILSLNSFAQNNVTVFSEDGLPFYLILNGIRQNENPETNVRLEGLNQEMMTAKVIFNDESIPEIDKKWFAVANDGCRPCDVTYKIKTNKKGEVVMNVFAFNQLFNAPPPPPNVTVVQYNTTPMPTPVLGVQVTETTTTTVNGMSDNVNVGMNVGGLNMGVNVNVNDGFGTSQTTTTTTQTITSGTPVMTNQTVVNAPPPCNTMNGPAFQNFLGSINSKGFDEDKLTIAKQATSSNCLTAQQIRQVMEQFSFEDNKLDYARFAYNYCLDQNNYWQVNDAFDFDSSIDELNNSIRR